MTEKSAIFTDVEPLPSLAQPQARTGGLLLVGTATTLRQLRLTLHLAGQTGQVLGCLTGPGKGQVSASGKMRMLGSWDAASVDRALSLGPIAQALICLPSSMASLAEPVTLRLAEHGIPWRWIATASDQLAGRAPLPSPHGTNNPAAWTAAAGLLGRSPRPIDHDAVGRILRAQTVLITGSGGSIGSELARQVAAFEPAKLVLLERSENALFEIHREIRRLHPDLEAVPVLHDVTDASRTDWIVAQHMQGAGVIFHAAAHKHVPMMEEHPWAAIENNFYGTRWMADAADRAGAQRFVMISTDKAVRPTSIMGATKRLAERYIQWLNARSNTRFCMVRFGNVLGSACSVLPIWQEQLSRGGPVTVTHPEMARYFMTIPEAAGLVLQSAALTGEVGEGTGYGVQGTGQEKQAGSLSTPSDDGSPPHTPYPVPRTPSLGGEVFLLDMGSPIRILDLAQRFIRFHGLEPGSDIPIQFSGIRPGEKLFEELAYDGEDMIPTPHDSVRIWKSQPPAEREMRRIISDFDRLRHPATVPGTAVVAGSNHLWAGADKQAILDVLRRAIPEMQTPASDLLPAKVG